MEIEIKCMLCTKSITCTNYSVLIEHIRNNHNNEVNNILRSFLQLLY